VAKHIVEQVEDVLDEILALRQEIASLGKSAFATSPSFPQALLARPEGLDDLAALPPYTEITPGLRLGFQSGAKPALTIAPDGEGGILIAMDRSTRSPWLTIEIDWSPSALLAKQQAQLIMVGASSAELQLLCVLRYGTADDGKADLSAQLHLGPEVRRLVARFPAPADVLAEDRPLRILLFLPTEPFELRLSELKVI
jgi:hypothetical protein